MMVQSRGGEDSPQYLFDGHPLPKGEEVSILKSEKP